MKRSYMSAITHEAAAYFEAPSAALLLLNPDGASFRIGYSIGLQKATPDKDVRLKSANTLAGQAVAQRQTLVMAIP